MTEEEIIEGNEIIARFMNRTQGYNENGIWQPFSYHRSWDWIIPVVRKIKKDKASVILLPKNGLESIAPYLEATRPVNKSLFELDITMLWVSVIDFIKWHNSNSPT